jgi:hypothetical protein
MRPVVPGMVVALSYALAFVYILADSYSQVRTPGRENATDRLLIHTSR